MCNSRASEEKTKKEKEWIDLVNVVSCIAVVFLHTNGCFWQFSTEKYWVTANIIESFFYFAVPCFFMITGATLMDYRERYSLETYCHKRIEKTVIPYIAWCLIGIVYSILVGDIILKDITFTTVWDSIINNQAVSIYWFFPALFGVYLTLPILAATSKNLRKKIFSWAAVAGVITIGILPLVSNLVGLTWNPQLNIQFGGYVLYTIIGYLISEYEMSKRIRMIVYFAGFAGLLLHIMGTYYLSINAGDIIQTFKGYTNLPCILDSLGVFVWIKYNGNRILQYNFLKRLVNHISPYTLGIYLTQYFIFTSIVRIFDIDTFSILYRLGAPFIVIPSGMLIIWVIRKVPVLRRITP